MSALSDAAADYLRLRNRLGHELAPSGYAGPEPLGEPELDSYF